MKKSFFLSALCLALAIGSHAQSGFEAGFRVIPEFTSLFNKNDADAGNDLNFKSHFTYISFGVGGIYHFNNNIGLGIDILFSREGQAFTGNFFGKIPDPKTYSSVVATQLFLNDTVIVGDYDALAELNYIKLPLMLSLTTDNTKSVFLSIMGGPQINFLEGVAQEVDGEDFEYPNTDFTPKDLYKPVTLGGILALGAACNLTSHLVLSMQLRLDYGFDDAEKKDVMVSYFGQAPVNFYSPQRGATHSATTGLMVGLNFKL